MTLEPLGEALSGGTRTLMPRGNVMGEVEGETRCFASQLKIAGECWLISVEIISMR
jgi:hypothetical protein